MSRPLRHTTSLSDGRVLVIDIAERGEQIEMWFAGKEDAKLVLTSGTAYVIGQALVNAAIAVGYREANRRDQKTAARNRDDNRRRLAAAGKAIR